jgi:hypothetical protein
LRIKVDLLGGGGIDCDPPPGRIFIVGPSHTFEELAQAINSAFARWDRSHLHEFELADGRLIGYPDDTFEPDVVWLDQAKLKVCREVKPGDEFEFTFDLGDNWRHRCVVDSAKADPLKEHGAIPSVPVASGAGARFRTNTAGARSTAATRTSDTVRRPGRLFEETSRGTTDRGERPSHVRSVIARRYDGGD